MSSPTEQLVDRLTRGQLTYEDLRDMSFQEIEDARRNGRLNDLLANGRPESKETYRTRSGVSDPINNRDFTPNKSHIPGRS